MLQGRPLGTVRLDDRGDAIGCVRLVAITAVEQGKRRGRVNGRDGRGHGAAAGIHTLYVNAAASAVGLYEKMRKTL